MILYHALEVDNVIQNTVGRSRFTLIQLLEYAIPAAPAAAAPPEPKIRALWC